MTVKPLFLLMSHPLPAATCGFWIAAYRAWGESDPVLLMYPLMMLGIGLLIFRGVALFMNAWVLWAAYISHREMREEE